MKKAGVTDYEAFAREIISLVPDLPISLEVFADEFLLMAEQARKISIWGKNVYVKIPITNTRGESSLPLVKELVEKGLKLNVTAILTFEQVKALNQVLQGNVPTIVSVFAGRIADTGRDPVPIMRKCAELLKPRAKVELLWASPREIWNVYQAEECGCQIITLTRELIEKLGLRGKDLHELSRETVQIFYDDACRSNFNI